MAKLKSNGECFCELRVYKHDSDHADADQMTNDTTVIYRAMESGKMLKKIQNVLDFGLGKTEKHSTGWKVSGKIKPHLIGNRDATRNAMFEWQEQLMRKGISCEIVS